MKRTKILAFCLIIIGILPLFSFLMTVKKANPTTLTIVVIVSFCSIAIFCGVGLLREIKITWWGSIIFLSISLMKYIYSFGSDIFNNYFVQGSTVVFSQRFMIVSLLQFALPIAGIIILLSDKPKNWQAKK